MPATRTVQRVEITPPNFLIAEMKIVGTAPLVENKFSKKAQETMIGVQEAGSTARGKKKRDPKDFESLWKEAMHVGDNGKWEGIPAAAFRKAMISACKLVGFAMTRAKITIFVLPDGRDIDGTQLVRITKGKAHRFDAPVRLAGGGATDIRTRPMWDEGWETTVRIRFDADIFTIQDIYNLMYRVGQQIGILEGRPDSKDSAGQGWGLFDLITAPPDEAKKKSKAKLVKEEDK